MNYFRKWNVPQSSQSVSLLEFGRGGGEGLIFYFTKTGKSWELYMKLSLSSFSDYPQTEIWMGRGERENGIWVPGSSFAWRCPWIAQLLVWARCLSLVRKRILPKVHHVYMFQDQCSSSRYRDAMLMSACCWPGLSRLRVFPGGS